MSDNNQNKKPRRGTRLSKNTNVQLLINPISAITATAAATATPTNNHDFPVGATAAPQRKGKRKPTDSPSTTTEVAADIDNNNQWIYFALDTGDATVMENYMVEVALDRNDKIRIDAIKEAVLQKFSKVALKGMDASCLQVYSGRDKERKLDNIAPWNVKRDGGDSSNPLMVKVIRRSDTSSIEDGTYSKFNICFEWSCYR
jgi:hypothetical protein